MSGSPKVQPGVYFGNGGRSLSSPFGAPASTQATMVSISFCESLRSLLNLSVEVCGSAYQGGISRSTTASRMALLHGRTSAYDVSGIGATSPGRWQLAHLLNMIGETSLVKVTPAASFLFTINAAAAVSITSSTMNKRLIVFLLRKSTTKCGTIWQVVPLLRFFVVDFHFSFIGRWNWPPAAAPCANPVCRACNRYSRSSSLPRSAVPNALLSSGRD